MPKIRYILILSILLSLSSVGWAGITPQAGLWTIVTETTGEPGRGLAIDVQGDTLILTVYGYTKEGRSTFYQASGSYVDGQFSGELGMYGGGTALGGERVAAQYLGSAGTVSLTFSSEAEGSVTLPGEEAKEITRFVTKKLLTKEMLSQLTSNQGSTLEYRGGDMYVVDEGSSRISQSYGLRSGSLDLSDSNFVLQYSIAEDEEFSYCSFKGNASQFGSSLVSEGNYYCHKDFEGRYAKGKYRIKDFQVTQKNPVPEEFPLYYLTGSFYLTPEGSESAHSIIFISQIKLDKNFSHLEEGGFF